ncbi:MOTHER of FT and TFL1-like protein [Drosera capensis]
MARSVDPLVVGRVIGDVLEMFNPSVKLTVCYGTKQISTGCDVKPSMASERPHVHVDGPCRNSRDGFRDDDLFTLVYCKIYVLASSLGRACMVMVDPDAPSPSEPTLREWLHWMFIVLIFTGREIVEYTGPRPPSGIHRYVFGLFKQQGGPLGSIRPPSARNNFSTRQFAAEHDLGVPVAAAYFNSQKEPMSNRRR